MGTRKIDARRIKIHRNYTVTEAAQRIGVHKNTIQAWLGNGLPHIASPRPILILGHDLKRFLDDRRKSARKPCSTGELFCLKCRAPRRPAGQMLDYVPITLRSGNLKGICEVCETFIYRRVSRDKIAATFPDCHVAFPQAQQRLTEPA
jgi:excisionase family DNA binding protein